MTVLSFEFMNFMRSKVYLGITIVMVILLGIGLSLPALINVFRDLGLSGPDQPTEPGAAQTIHIIDRTGLLTDLASLGQAWPAERWQAATPAEQERLRQLVDQGQAKALLVIDDAVTYTFIERRAGDSSLPWQLSEFLARFFREQNLLGLGLDLGQINRVLAQPQMIRVETLADSGKTMQQTYFYTYLLLFLLYMTVMLYGQLVATSVASEKSNRAMEMLITSARPLHLMFGKVMGSGLAGLAQIAAFLLAAAAFYGLNRSSWADVAFVQSIFHMPASILVYTIACYLMGYFMYAFLYGALSSLASRTEDINTSIMPIVLLTMGALFVAMFGMMSPEAGWLTACSFVPFLAPMALFVRICMTDVPAWQIALSFAIMLATISGTGYLASRIYRLGILMYGKPPRLKEVLTMLRH
jgi:ABC-2 type transport system permease protein